MDQAQVLEPVATIVMTKTVINIRREMQAETIET